MMWTTTQRPIHLIYFCEPHDCYVVYASNVSHVSYISHDSFVSYTAEVSWVFHISYVPHESDQKFPYDYHASCEY